MLRMQNIILQVIDKSHDESVIESIPVAFIVKVFVDSEQRTAAFNNFFKRYFINLGGQIFSSCDNSIRVETTPQALNCCEKLLDKLFCASSVGFKVGSAASNYLLPVQWIMAGIVARASFAAKMYRSAYEKDFATIVAFCFAHFLVVLLNAVSYSAGVDAIDEAHKEEFWNQVKAQLMKTLNGKNFQPLLQDVLIAMFASGDFVIFLASEEDKVLVSGQALSPLYLCLSAAFGEKLVQIDQARSFGSYKQEVGVVSYLLQRSIDLLPIKGVLMCSISYSYAESVFDFVTRDFMQRSAFVPLRSLRNIPAAFLAMENDDAHYCNDLLKYQDKFVALVMAMLIAVQDCRLTLRDVKALESNADVIAAIADAFQIEMNREALNLDSIVGAFTAFGREADALLNVITFLDARKLCPNFASWKSRLSQNASETVPLCQLKQVTADIIAEMQLENEVLSVLTTFSRDSDLFADRFGDDDDVAPSPSKMSLVSSPARR